MAGLPTRAAWFALTVACLSVAPVRDARPEGLTPEALARRLATLTGEPLELTDREKDLLSDAREGKLSRVTLAEAALLASGVRDEAAKKKYLDRIDALEKDARRATADARTPFDKGARLLTWLHAGPMANGYSKSQDHLPALLDEGKFNCVSSTVMYNILGKRLGLDLRGILNLGHIFSIQYDGETSKDVQTTNARGFDFERQSRNRREVGDFGVLAAVFRNTAIRMGKKEHHPEAIRAALFAQALDPQGRKQTEDVEGAFHNWCVSHFKKGGFTDALAVLTLGLEVLPDNTKLIGDRSIVYAASAKSHREKGEWAKAAKMLREAVSAHPGDRGLVLETEQHYVLWSQSEPTRAAEILQEALNILPKSAKLKQELARVKKKQAR